MDTKKWRINCSKEQFESLKSDDAFIGLISLARFLSCMRFCLKAMKVERDEKGKFIPFDSTQLIDSFVFASSVFFEGYDLVKKLGEYFKCNDAFKNAFRPFFRDKGLERLIGGVLCIVRNKFVFHYDKSFTMKALETFDVPAINFATGIQDDPTTMRFDLSTELSMHYLLQVEDYCDSSSSEMERYAIIVRDTTDYMVKFSIAVEKFLADELNKRGFKIETEIIES